MKIYNNIIEQINKSVIIFNINNSLIKYLEKPNKIIHVNIPFILNDKYILIDGYRVQHNNLLGEYKGGLRFNENVNLDECKALSAWMTYKTALYNLPLGGGKGGICINPNQLNDKELEDLSRKFISLIYNNIGENKDIPAPDVGTNSKIINFMDDEMYKLTGSKNNFTGKSLDNRGCIGRNEATGFGVVEIFKFWAEKNNFQIKNSTFIIQGFGNVGSFTSIYLNNLGAKLIGVSDHSCCLFDSNGIDVNNLVDYCKIHKCIKGFLNNEILIDEFWKIKCNIVIPAALELQINENIAKNLDCDIIIEAANGPLYINTDNILREKNIDVLPDILCNSGGVIVSYYEYLQNKNNKYETSMDIMLNKLSNHMKQIFDKVYLEINRKNITYRDACYGIALLNLYDKFKLKF